MKYKNKEDLDAARELVSPPGDTLMETLVHKGISQSELAARMGRPVKTINEIVMGKTAILPETAIQLENVLGIQAEFWLERERNYRLELAKIDASEEALASTEWVSGFPVNLMRKWSWINGEKDLISTTGALLRFFSVAHPAAYHRFYQKYRLAPAFRLKQTETNNANAIIAWLRRGDIQAEVITAPPFDLKKFKAALPAIRQLMIDNPVSVAGPLQAICLPCGAKVVFTPCLPKAPVSGATRWLKDHPVIQLSGRYKRNDIFWFTFFHEAGHILLHGKKDFFLEESDGEETVQHKELEANEFAVEWTFPLEAEKEVTRALPLTAEKTSFFARKFNTHPSMIIGRLAKADLVHESFGWKYHFFCNLEVNSQVDLPG